MPWTAGSAFSRCDQGQQFVLACLRRQLVLERIHAGFDGLLALVADIDLARRILADEHHGEARRQAVLFLESRDMIGHPCANAGCERLAVDDLRRHSDDPFADFPPLVRYGTGRIGETTT